MRISPLQPLSVIANAYVQFFRGLPQYVFILWLYYGIAILFGINFPPVSAGVNRPDMQYGAYMSEIYRSGIQAIHKGQMEAGLSVGTQPAPHLPPHRPASGIPYRDSTTRQQLDFNPQRLLAGIGNWRRRADARHGSPIELLLPAVRVLHHRGADPMWR